MKHRKIYRGWIDAELYLVWTPEEYPNRKILFHADKFFNHEHPVKITVEWTEPKRKGK